MDKFNEHILLVMRWLQNPDLVSQEELRANYDASYAAYRAASAAASASAAANAAYNAYMATCAEAVYAASYNAARYAAYNAASAAHTTTYAAECWLSVTEERLDKYFELTKEDRKAYERQVRHLSILGGKNE